MNLEAIPAGSAVLIDANVAIYARRGMSEECRRLFARCAAGEIHGLMTAVGVAEFCHRRMMQEAQSLGLCASNPAKALGANPSLVARLSQYAKDVEDLLAGDLRILPVESGDLLAALALQKQHQLLTNDSLHIAVGLRVGVANLATSDPQFDKVSSLTVFKPGDLA
jgi:predicted nucleic acid-binding protein